MSHFFYRFVGIYPKKLNTRKQLIKILSSANQKVPYYKGKLNLIINKLISCKIQDILNYLSEIPVISKDTLIEHNQSMINSEEINNKIFLNLNNLQKIYYLILNQGMLAQSTGGTSGKSTLIYMNISVAKKMLQTFYKSFIQTGRRKCGNSIFKLGDKIMIFYPEKSYFTTAYIQHNSCLKFFGVRMVGFNVINKTTIESLIEEINHFKPKILVIFPFVLWKVAHLIDTHNLYHKITHHITLINISGEPILDCAIQYILKFFPQACIDSTYGAVEFGEIAHQISESYYEYKIFNDYALVHQDDEDNCLIVTSLYQTTFPIIRYKTDDIGYLATHYENQTIKQFIKPLLGKKDIYFKVNGQCFYANHVNVFINQLNKVMQLAIINCKFIVTPINQSNDNIKIIIILNLANILALKQIYATQIFKQKIKDLFERSFGCKDFLDIHFSDDIQHDYLKKYKFIDRGESACEPVGGAIL